MLSWFSQNPDRHWWLVCFALAGTFFILLRPLLQPDWKDAKGTDWRWGLVILLVLIVGRWPTWFVPRELNPDESQLLAGAITLHLDPVFWHLVKGGSSGPLDFYALLPAGWIHGADDYFSARITALCLIAATLVFAHQIVALVFGRMVARFAAFSTVCFESLTLHAELLQYSTELLPICLLAAAFFLGVRRFVGKTGWQWNFVGGLLLSAMPFGKLHALSLAGLLALGWIAGEIWMGEGRAGDRRNRLVALCGGLSVPLLVCALILTVTGQWRFAMATYLSGNVSYINAVSQNVSVLLLLFLRETIIHNSMVVSWIAGGGLWLMLTLPLMRAGTRQARVIAAFSAVLLFASMVDIMVPRRPFCHYLQFMVVPWTLVLGSTTGLIMAALEGQRAMFRCGVLCATLLCTTGGLLFERAGYRNPFVSGELGCSVRQGAVAAELMKYARTGESLAIWGWANDLYVQTGLRKATRAAITPEQIDGGPYSDFLDSAYLSDLRSSDPPVFVDAVGPGSFYYGDRRLAHDAIFPELAAYIRAHYTQVADLHGSRIYVRNDRLPAAPR